MRLPVLFPSPRPVLRLEGGWWEQDKAGSHHTSWPWQQFQAMGCTMGGGQWLIAPSRNFICIVRGRGAPQCPCSRTTIAITAGLHSHGKSMHVKKGGRDPGTLWLLGNELKDGRQWSQGPFPKIYEGALESRCRGGFCSPFFFLLPSHARGKGAEREGGSGSSAVLGARLAAAVPYSIFWSPCESRSLVEPAVVSEWKTSHAITLGQAVAACPQRVPACSAFLWQKPAPIGGPGLVSGFLFSFLSITLFPVAFK